MSKGHTAPLLLLSVSPLLFFAFRRKLLLRFPGRAVLTMPGHDPTQTGFRIFSGIITEGAVVTNLSQ
jgi:hypothetical protein